MLLAGGCDIINPADPVPAYVYMADMPLSVSPGEGSASEHITEAWFYADGDFLGAYAMPALIPVIATGPTEILVFPGVRVNGIASTPDIYPFYRRFEATIDLAPEKTDTLRPTTTYLSDLTFAINEGFETSNGWIDDLDGDPETGIEQSETDVFEGTRSGRIVLTPANPLAEVASLPLLDDLPTNSSPVYLELDYKNNTEFSIGLVGHQTGIGPTRNTLLFVRKRDDWSKIYVDLTEALFLSQLEAYQVMIRATHDPDNTESEVLLDNIKLVHFRQ